MIKNLYDTDLLKYGLRNNHYCLPWFNGDRMRNYRLHLNFSNHLYKAASRSSQLKNQNCLSEPDEKFPRDKGQTLAFLSPSLRLWNIDWVSDGSAKLVENNFDILKMSKDKWVLKLA